MVGCPPTKALWLGVQVKQRWHFLASKSSASLLTKWFNQSVDFVDWKHYTSEKLWKSTKFLEMISNLIELLHEHNF